MGRDLHFRPGSFYRVSDRTGFPTRAERTRKEWQNLIVEDWAYEPRQPQDLVRGVPDWQTVPEPRPLAPNQYVGPQWVQLAAPAPAGTTLLQVQSLSGLSVGQTIAVMTDMGQNFDTTIASFIGGAVILDDPLPYAASSGNLVQYPGPFPLVEPGPAPAPPPPPSVFGELDFSTPDDSDLLPGVQ